MLGGGIKLMREGMRDERLLECPAQACRGSCVSASSAWLLFRIFEAALGAYK